jgi:nondiscriminating aspartyl-tRNA synthetase
MRILTGEVKSAAEGGEKSVELSGWVHRIRELGAVTFVILRDRGGLAQLVFNEKPKNGDGSPLTLESVIRVEGRPALNEKAPGGAEIQVAKIEVLSRANVDLPFQVNGDIEKVGLEAILDNRLLSLRNPKIRSIFKVQATIIDTFGAYMRKNDFTEIKSTKLVSGSTEGGTELFRVKYFDREVCLAQSPQFYKEALVASGLERVFEIAPAYRAEKHDTPRHLNEYVSLDVEMGFIESERDLIELERGYFAYAFDEIARRNAEDLRAWDAAVPTATAVKNAPVISYEEAVKIANAEAQTKGSGAKLYDINPEAERLVCAWSLRENGSDIVFVNEFPRRERPFYTYPSGPASTMSFDCLFRGLEITTGGRRQHEMQAVLDALPRFGLKEEDMRSYLALFEFGCPPHGGFAIGAERLTQKILGLGNVKEASLFPRDRKRVTP